MTDARVRVDFNRRAGSGYLRAAKRALGGASLASGDRVIVFQPGEEMEYFARVVSVDDTTGGVDLNVNWNSRPARIGVAEKSGNPTFTALPTFLVDVTLPYSISYTAMQSMATAHEFTTPLSHKVGAIAA